MRINDAGGKVQIIAEPSLFFLPYTDRPQSGGTGHFQFRGQRY